jgi:hypothetical protein
VGTAADTTTSKINVVDFSRPLVLGDILDVGEGQKITQEQENKVSPGTLVLR